MIRILRKRRNASTSLFRAGANDLVMTSFKSVNNLGFVFLLLVAIGCSCPKLNDLAKKRTEPSPSTTPAPFSTPANTSMTTDKKGEYELSMPKYNQISVGTSRSDVERILGGKGTELSNSVGGGVRFSVNKWEGANYSAIILSFRNDKVMTKSQVALK